MSIETPEGRLLRFESEIRMGPGPVRVTGEVHGKRLDMKMLGAEAAAPQESSIDWPADCGGPFAIEQSLARKPMQPGERRTLKTFMAGFNQVADMELAAKQFEPTRLLHGAHDLLRIETVTRLPLGDKTMKIEQTVWTDRTGEVLKTYSPTVGGLETFRVSKAEALEKADAAELDLLSSMMVKVDRRCSIPARRSKSATGCISKAAIRRGCLSPARRSVSGRSTRTRPRSRSTRSGRASRTATAMRRPIRPPTTTAGRTA